MSDRSTTSRAAGARRKPSKAALRRQETKLILKRLPKLKAWSLAIVNGAKEQLRAAISLQGLNAAEVSRRLGKYSTYTTFLLRKMPDRAAYSLGLDDLVILAAVIGVDPLELFERSLAQCGGPHKAKAPKRSREQVLVDGITRDLRELQRRLSETQPLGPAERRFHAAALELLRAGLSVLAQPAKA
jgi:hypothetical protein